MLKFTDPRLNLIETVAKYGREKPVTRCVYLLVILILCFLRMICHCETVQIAQGDRSTLDISCVRGGCLLRCG